MTTRIAITDRRIQALKPAPEGKRYQAMDSLVPGFGIRVTDKGTKTYIVQARLRGQKNDSRREIGKVGVLALGDARERARDFLAQIKQGIDPALTERRKAEEAAKLRANTFGAVFSDYVERRLSTLKSGKTIERDLRRHVLPLFKDEPLAEITDIEILTKLVNPRLRTGPVFAGQLLNFLRTFLTWAVDQRVYGLKSNPAAGLKTARVAAKWTQRQRVLSDSELRALWIASERMYAPVGPFYRVLMLTGLRLKEALHTSKGEWNLRDREWIIPASRMKGKVAHMVPITDELAEIAERLMGDGRQFLFTFNGGGKPVTPSHRLKAAVDREMLKVLRESNPDAEEPPHWTNHDIRRTVRSKLSKLRVRTEVAEAILAHAKPGIIGIYDQHNFADEKREALELWAAELRRIVNPPSDNVVQLRA